MIPLDEGNVPKGTDDSKDVNIQAAPLSPQAYTNAEDVMPEIKAFVQSREGLMNSRAAMIQRGELVPRDDLDIEEMEKEAGETGYDDVTLPEGAPLPNPIEGGIRFRILTAQQYRTIFGKPWDNLFPQRPTNQRPNGQQYRGPHGQSGAPPSKGDPKWDQPENIHSQATIVNTSGGIFNLGDIRNAKGPLASQGYDNPIDAREMERHLHAQAAAGGNMPNYPQNQGHMTWNSAYGQPEKSQFIKAAIGMVGSESEIPSVRDAAARQMQQRKDAMESYLSMDQLHGGAGAQAATAGGAGQHGAQQGVAAGNQARRRHEQTVQRQPMTNEERQQYEYYQQCIPALKCVSVEALPEYINMNPQIKQQIHRIESDMQQAQVRLAQFHHYAQAQLHHQQQHQQWQTQGQQQPQGGQQGQHNTASGQTSQQGTGDKASELTPQQQQQQQQWQQYQRQQQAMYHQQMAAAQQMRQQGGQGSYMHQSMTPQQQQQYYLQQQYYHQMVAHQQHHARQTQQAQQAQQGGMQAQQNSNNQSGSEQPGHH